MLLPVVSEATRKQVWEEVKKLEDRDESFAAEMMHRLCSDGENENPAIADFLYRVFQSYQGKPWLPRALAYGFFVYRLLEIEAGGKLPRISAEVGAPMQQEFFNNPPKFVRSIMIRIVKQNFQVAVANNDFVWMQVLSDDPEEKEIAVWVFTIGAVVYRFIESQFEAERMSKIFG